MQNNPEQQAADGPPVPPRPDLHVDQPPIQFLRAPPLLKMENDLELYLRRFNSYVNAVGARPEELVNLLINCLSDEVLMTVERHITPNLTFHGFVDILRREVGGAGENLEEFKTLLRKTLRGRNENVRTFYIKLYNLAKKAFPGEVNAAVRNHALRDAFVNNIHDAQISARLREEPGLDWEGG